MIWAVNLKGERLFGCPSGRRPMAEEETVDPRSECVRSSRSYQGGGSHSLLRVWPAEQNMTHAYGKMVRLRLKVDRAPSLQQLSISPAGHSLPGRVSPCPRPAGTRQTPGDGSGDTVKAKASRWQAHRCKGSWARR